MTKVRVLGASSVGCAVVLAAALGSAGCGFKKLGTTMVVLDGGGTDPSPGADAGPTADLAPPPDLGPSDRDPGVASLTIDKAAHDFGMVVAQTPSADALFVVTNVGGGATTPITVSLSGAGLGFSIKTDRCSGASLAGGATCQVIVSITPVAAGAASGDLTVSAGVAGTVSAHLSATAIGAGAFRISPSAQDFGMVIQNRGSASQTFTVSNGGGQLSGAAMVSLGGTDKADFQITSDGCSAQPLGPNGTCQVTVRFGPTTVGAKSASLTVSGNPGGSAVAQISGAGLTQGTVTISPDTFDFGSTLQMTAGGSQAFTVKNSGQATTGVLATSLSGSDIGSFSVSANTCDAHTLAANATCTVTVTFSPTSVGSKLATLSVVGAAGETGVAQLAGRALAGAAMALSPNSKAFNLVTVNQSASATFVITNPGGVATGVPAVAVNGVTAADNGQFTIPAGSNGCGAALPPGGSCTVTVRFAPTTTGAKNGTLSVTASPGGSAAATLTGTGVAPGKLAVSPLNQDFGSLLQGTTGTTPVDFTVTNSGATATGTLQASIVGTTEFLISADTCSSKILAAAAPCTVSVMFAPTSASPSGSLQILATNPADSTSAALTGTGLLPAKLSITPTSTSFLDTLVGQTSAAVSFAVRNSGGVAAGTGTGLAVAIQGANATDFGVVATGNTCTGMLAPGGTCMLSVVFTPKTAGNSKTASVNVSATPGGSVAAALAGNGLTPAALSLAPAANNAVAFGNVVVGVPKDQTFVVKNGGQQPTSALTIAFTNPAGPGFSLLSGGAGDCAANTSLGGNATCNLRVHFAPSGRGTQSASLAVSAATGGAPPSLALSGTGQLPAGLSANPATVSLGNLLIGASASTSVIITNGGDVATGVPTVSNGDPAEITIVTNGCIAAIGAGASCTISLTFKPSAAGARAGTLTVSASGSSAVFTVVANGTVACGALNQQCCTASGSPPCGANLTCAAATSTCACGGMGQPCCGGVGGTCNAVGIVCAAGACTGVCMPGTTACLDETSKRTCNPSAQWDAPISCANVCRNGQCTTDPKTVFVTSQAFGANMGGLPGADALCMQSAAGLLSGTYKAWLSDSTTSPANRFTHGGPYMLPSSVVIANNWAQLTSGTLLHAINVTERQTAPPASLGCNSLFGPVAVWSDTLESGAGFSIGGSCANWTSTTGLFVSYGRSDATQNWSSACNSGNGSVNVCNTANSLFCVQQ